MGATGEVRPVKHNAPVSYGELGAKIKAAAHARGLVIKRRRVGETVVLELNGRLDASLDRNVVGALQSHIDKGDQRIVIDCGGFDYLGSPGVSAFIAVIDILRGRGGDLKLARATPQAGLVLDRLGVS